MKNNAIYYFLLLSSHLAIISCTHAPLPQPKPNLNLPAKTQLKTLLYQYNRKQISENSFIVNLKNIEQKYPNTYSFFQAIFLRSKIAKKNKQLNTQIQLLQKIALSHYDSPLIKKAIIQLINIIKEQKKYAFGVSFILKLEIKKLDKDFKNYLYTQLFAYHYYLQDYFKSLKWGQHLAKNKALTFSIEKQVHWIIQERLTKKEIVQLITEGQHPALEKFALMRYGKQLLANKKFTQAKQIFSQLLNSAITQNEKQLAFSFLQKIQKYRKVDKNKIGLIVPLTGKYAKIGQAIVNAVSLGLGIWDRKTNSWLELIIVDSHGTPQYTELAIHKLLTQDHVIAIIGNPLSKTSEIVAKTASQFEVPYISLSQSPNITLNRPYVFRNAITSKMQLEALFTVVNKNFNTTQWATLYPNDNYGVKHANLFWDILLQNQHQLMGAQTYPPKEKDFNKEIQRLTGIYFLEDRRLEYKLALNLWLSKNKNKKRQRSVPDHLLKPIVQFQGLFIPDTFKNLVQISNMLIYHQIENVMLLGTNLWNKPKLIKHLPQYAPPILFADSNLTYKQKINSYFYKQFKKIFRSRPHLLASYAYEAALLVRELLTKNSINHRKQLQIALSQIPYFPGAFETLYISKNREFTRPLSLFEIKKGKITTYTNTEK